MGLHSTRKTFATILLKEAEDKGQIKEVSEVLGHSEVATTYKGYIDVNVKQIFTSLGNVFFTLYGKQFFTSYGKEIFIL